MNLKRIRPKIWYTFHCHSGSFFHPQGSPIIKTRLGTALYPVPFVESHLDRRTPQDVSF